MLSIYGGNGKTWGEMTEEERKICLIVVGVMVVALVAGCIYEYFKNKKNKK